MSKKKKEDHHLTRIRASVLSGDNLDRMRGKLPGRGWSGDRFKSKVISPPPPPTNTSAEAADDTKNE